ncbi:sensor histidine kinase [Evansella cellulosilytica]|uniref:histidine kinase n=1 Tax=Evansella cellulosilytica (strain ATCC 21833 / DSM 2522 / FERM P-1141 / JCM 9156 / N-4) TaxID=649639 RepID=E6TZB8_EVAC2|nr:sensor histidine kinase [Evansella cellulosilytica]ADU28980.1 integral membrane sensor signal transduction histidine kinase [Evansella cellulosilytica DSM 2522]
MMRSFWLWLILLIIAWLFALTYSTTNLFEMPLRLISCTIFFALFFLSPLFDKKENVYTIILAIASLFTIISLWPMKGQSPNPYTIIVFSIIAGNAVQRLKSFQALIIGAILFIGLIIPHFFHYPTYPLLYIMLYTALVTIGLTAYKMTLTNEEVLQEKNEALLSEYRRLKRRIASDEKDARQEERAEIAREIHDSVGHRLTALLMQLEVFRMQAQSEEKEKIQELKLLAKESLEETRNAVKTLKHEDVGGLTAIINLIRRLEAESFIKVNFSIRHGALSVPLRNEQAVAVYRAVQEALTNMMRHSRSRHVDIVFEAPAGSVFRFEVSNPTTEKTELHEGFGLTSMRERIEQAGGNLEINVYKDVFLVRGTFPLLDKER